MFKLGDYVVNGYGIVIQIESETMKGIANKNPDNFRYATQKEIEDYYWEEYE